VVVAVTDPDGQAASAAARRFGGASVEPDASACMDRNDIDAVVLAATPQVHAEVAARACAKGLHIFVEKPPTVSRLELSQLVAEAEKKGLVTCVGHNLRHAAVALEMRAAIEGNVAPGVGWAERLGKPIAMEMRYYASKPRGDRWGLNSPLRSFLLSHANHAIDFMVFQMGPVSRVNAALASGGSQGVALAAQLVFASGAVGTLMATSLAPHFSIAGSVVTDAGRVINMESLHRLTVFGVGEDPKRWGREWTTKSLLTGYDAAGYRTELANFAQAIQRGSAEGCHPSFRDELSVYDAIDAIEDLIRDVP